MPNTDTTHAETRRFGFAIWGLVCLLISVVGFWPSYIEPLATGHYRSPSAMMPWHVLSTVLWLALIISQPALIQFRRVSLHRAIGVFGAVVAIGLVVTGVIVQLDVMKWYATQGDTLNAVTIPFFRFSILLVYAVCVGVAIVRRKEADWHKRLIFLGTFALLEAPFDRMYGNVFGLSDDVRGPLALGSHLVLMIMFVIWDRRAFGCFHPATKWGTILIVAFLVLTPPIASTEWWRAVAAGLAAD